MRLLAEEARRRDPLSCGADGEHVLELGGAGERVGRGLVALDEGDGTQVLVGSGHWMWLKVRLGIVFSLGALVPAPRYFHPWVVLLHRANRSMVYG